MFSNNIEGIEVLKEQLPDELQCWHKFGHNILELSYKHIFDYDKYFDYIKCVELLLTDSQNRYKIKMFLYNVTGDLSFNMFNGFYSGFAIEDCHYAEYESTCRFCIFSFEQDIDFTLYCEKIKVELL